MYDDLYGFCTQLNAAKTGLNNSKRRKSMKNVFKRICAFGCAALCAAVMPVYSLADYSSFDYITSHVDLKVPQTLQITRPAEDITVNSAYYYIMGNSDPSQPLYLGDYEITTRGKQGSFGIYVALSYGKNMVTLKNGGNTASVCITRSDTAEPVMATTISSMYPSVDTADFVGKKVTLSCTAPAGAVVTAQVKSRTVELKQVAATAVNGVAATYKGEYTMPDADGTVSLGNVTYTMTYNGSTVSKTSAGELITTGYGDNLTVECTQVSAGVQKEPNGAYIATAKLGAVDNVVDTSENHYKLSMGGWISKANVKPLLGKHSIKNNITSITFTQEPNSEVYTFVGTANALIQSWQTEDTLYLNMFSTSGLGDFTTEHSSLFESSHVTLNENGTTTLQLKIKPDVTLWGHTVQYDNGSIALICKYKPVLTGDTQQPLKGITIALDAGHGSSDTGALGLSQLKGPTESDINRATAIAVKKYLEAMGANVLLPDQLDLNSRFNERMQPAIDGRADLFISLHCNATVSNADGTKPKGIETYYYEGIGQNLAQNIMDSMLAHTGRQKRVVKFYEFRVTLNSLAPSVLVEMGFMTNPDDYDDLCSKQGIYNTAVAIGDAVLKTLA